jgi:hypothetical protein
MTANITKKVWLATSIVLVFGFLSVTRAQVTHTICDVQEYDGNGFSPLVGQSVTVSGAVTFPPGILNPLFTSFYIEADGCGVSLFSFESLPATPALGDSVEVTGSVEEYVSATIGATTEIFFDFSADVEIVSTGNAEPLPADMGVAAMQVEDNEGRLLRTVGIVDATDHDSFIDLRDGSAVLRVNRFYNESVSFAVYEVGDSLRITGILFQRDADAPYLDGYELFPRFQEDIEPLHSTSVNPTSWGRVKTLYR